MDEMRKLLDSLMGPNRNRDKPNASEHFSDEHVCKLYLCGLCPHELFTNTVRTTQRASQPTNQTTSILETDFFVFVGACRKWTFASAPSSIPRSCNRRTSTT